MDIFNYFRHAFNAELNPTLLEFSHPVKKTAFSICGIRPSTTLMVKGGRLYIDGKDSGNALDIFDHLTMKPCDKFFPAYLGYFSYEFAQYFSKACKKDNDRFPDAFFRLYEHGLVIDDNEVLQHDVVAETLLSPLEEQFKNQTPKAPIGKEEFFSIVNAIKQKITLGDVYQVNLSLPFSFNVDDKDMLSLYSAMRNNNKSPFMGIMRHDENWILSGSPERLFSRYQGKITTRPIAGTKKRRMDPAQDQQQIDDLKNCAKENAEHAMLVDLMRNDLNQVALPTTVSIDEDRSIEFYSHVMHLVSELSCESKADLRTIFSALFPGGTVTGAPKSNVTTLIAELEKTARGPYTGSFGYSSGMGADFNILIRSVFKDKDEAVINAGAGIVMDSDEENEWEEIHKKAQALKDILENKSQPALARKILVGPPLLGEEVALLEKARVLFLENCDSFSYNIVDALRALGAKVEIERLINSPHPRLHHTQGEREKDIYSLSWVRCRRGSGVRGTEQKYTHVVIGPGPGNPEDMPLIADAIKETLRAGLPLLGICLGHQAIGHFFGARIKKIATPLHGKIHPVKHFSRGLFANLPSPLTFVRYHSLAVDRAPENFMVDAHTEDDCIMAIRHNELPIFGVQFHPESYLSRGGSALLHQFLLEKSYGNINC